LWFKLPKNKSIRKTILNVVAVYLTTTILLLLTITIYYTQNQKNQIFHIYQKQIDLQADFLVEQFELLHDNILKEDAFYPRFNNIQSGIYDLDKQLIFKTFTQKVKFSHNKYILQDKFYYFFYKLEPYYLGAAYLVIQVPKSMIFNQYYTKIILIVLLIILLLVLTSFFIAKILIKPLSDNLIELDKFIKDTTHELNTPLSTILTNIEMLESSDLDQSYRTKINRVKLGAISISKIYEDLSFLLLYNKQKSNSIKLDLSSIVYDRIEYFTTLASSKNITFDTDIEDNVSITMDKVKLERVLDNLLSNSIKYSELNSIVYIKLTQTYFMIEDYGSGMTADELKDIFTRYKRFHKNIGGFGIGYSIIASILQEYNISIDIQSQKNVGTKVYLKW